MTAASWPVAPVELAPAPAAAFGLIALATDRVSGDDVRAFLPVDVALHVTRVPMAVVATPETLAAMEAHLEAAARVLVPGADLDGIVFSCTSGSVAIGTDVVARTIAAGRPGVPVVTPVEAAVAALRTLGARRVALLVPYLVGPAELIRGHLEAAGIAVAARASFDLPGDPEMNRVPASAIIAAGTALVAEGPVDALFVSCTGLRTRDVVAPLEERLGIPVVTSNQAAAWALLRVAGRADALPGRGRLLAG